MRVLPTRLGVRFLMLLTVLVLVYFVTAYSNLFFLLLCLISTVLAAGAVSARAAIARVRAEVGPSRPTPAGTPVVVPLRVTAAPGRGAAGVTFRVRCAGRTGAGAIPRVHAGREERCTIEGLPRGIHRLASATIDSAAPLGLFRARRRLTAPHDLVVTPCPVDLERRSMAGGTVQSLAALAQAAGATQPAGLRDHRPGDELRRIHWKASARGKGLLVRELEDDREPGIDIVLDLRCADDAAARARFEENLGIVTRLAELARERNEPLTLATHDSRRTYGPASDPLDDLMRWLATVQPEAITGRAPPAARAGTLVLRGDLAPARAT
jgi:uncharacterized protein (DUF58 family)